MKYMMYDPNFDPETAPEPEPEMMEEMGKFMGEVMQAGVLVTTGALIPQGTQLEYDGKEFTVTDAPFIELKELMAGFAVFEVDTLEEAIEWSKRFRKIIGPGATQIVPLFEAGGPDHA